VPTSVSEQALVNSAAAYGGGIVLSVLLGVLAARIVSRGIERPIEHLRESAVALGRGETVRGAESTIAEIEAMSAALVAAAERRARSAAERETLLEAERSARASAEKAQDRLHRLAGASALLSNSLEESSTLEAIASLIVPGVADACRIDLIDANGVLQRKITHHVDPVRRQAIESFVSRTVAPPETPGTFPWVISTGRSFLANFSGEMPSSDAGVREFVRLVGIRSVFSVPLIARGQTIGAMAVMQADSGRSLTTEDVALVTELAQRAALALDNVRLMAEARVALQEASVANRAKDEFLAMLGHELRNPLAPIVSALELMALRGDGGAKERRVIERQVRHLSRLVDDLLDVSRIASGKVELHREVVDLRDIAMRALELTQPAMQQRDAPRLVSTEAPLWVHGDPTRLTQAVCNLLINAAKFSSPQQAIRLLLSHDGAWQRLVVEDDGIGIAAELLPHIFERFVQGDQALHRAAGGLGLGLAIARNLVELHGGTIEAASAGIGQGSRFVVTLPVTDVVAPPAAPPSAAAAPTPMRVLIVDDNRDAGDSLAQLVALEGHEVRATIGGAEALELVEHFRPDVAVLDIGLPRMDGYELARRLRADPRFHSLRLVALTGYGRESDEIRAREAGFDVHLVKPVELDRLLQALVRPPMAAPTS
jgi:signal transduction histidine kinase/ActR/RegA family two-component response regulator